MHRAGELAQALPAGQRDKVLPYIRAWADSAAGLSGTEVFHASQQFHLTRVATVRACSAFDYVISPVAPMAAFAAELPSPTNDPLRPLDITLRLLDSALYTAKREGRSRTGVVWMLCF